MTSNRAPSLSGAGETPTHDVRYFAEALYRAAQFLGETEGLDTKLLGALAVLRQNLSPTPMSNVLEPIPREQWARKFDNELWSRSKCMVCGRGAFEGEHARCKISVEAYNTTLERKAMDEAHDEADAQPEMVNHPAHYGGADNPYEVIKVIEAWELSFHAGNAVKYIARAGKKDPTKEREDLEKARWYIERALARLR